MWKTVRKERTFYTPEEGKPIEGIYKGPIKLNDRMRPLLETDDVEYILPDHVMLLIGLQGLEGQKVRITRLKERKRGKRKVIDYRIDVWQDD